MADRTRPTLEQLAAYAEGFNASATLRHFAARISFPSLDRVRATIDPVRPEQLGGMGTSVVNGGVLAAMFDLAIGCSSALVDPSKRSATMQLSMNFMRPCQGPRLYAEAWIDRVGGSTIFSSAELVDGAGDVVARCQGLVKIAKIGWAGGSSPAVN